MTAEKLVDALYAFTDCEVTISSRITVIRNNRPVELTVSEVLKANTTSWSNLKRELELREKETPRRFALPHPRTHFIEERITRKSSSAKPTKRWSRRFRGLQALSQRTASRPHRCRCGRLLQVRIRRISLFDINKHREEIEKTKGDLTETRKHLKTSLNTSSPTSKRCSQNTPALSAPHQSSRTMKWMPKKSRFKGFKSRYDRESGYVGHKVSGGEFALECTKFDKILLVFKDGHFPGGRIAGKNSSSGRTIVLRRACPNVSASLLAPTPIGSDLPQAFKFRRDDYEQNLSLHPAQIEGPFFETETPAELYIKYKPAPYQKINQQTCNPARSK